MDGEDVRGLPDRIEALLDRIAESGDQRIVQTAEDLVAAVVTLYGEGLARAAELLGGDEVRRLADDPLVGQLLLLHDLHPDDVETRIQAALDAVRPYLGLHEGGIEYHGVDDNGIAHLSLQGNCDSCPSSTVTIRTSVEQAVLDAAPEVVGIEVEGMVEATPTTSGLLQIQTKRPAFDSCPVPETVGS